MSTPIALYCKSYHRDVQRVRNLLDSVIKHNVDRIPFYVSVPSADKALFESKLGASGYSLICDTDIIDVPSHVPGWLQQQIVKSSFWKLGVCRNYVCLDSDSEFIRPFRASDFMFNDVPYTVMHEQHELFSWTCDKVNALGFDPSKSFAECRLRIMTAFDRTHGRLYDFGPSPVIWSSAVWKSFEEEYLTPAKMTLSQVLTEVPSEFTFYGEWLLASKAIPLLPIEPMFKVFHYQGQYTEMKARGVTLEQLSSVYMGVVMQSNAYLPGKY